MNNNPIKLEKLYNASPAKIWNALTDNEALKKWYFPLEKFEAKVGFKFSFYGGEEDDKQYLHECEITELIPLKKITYSWKYVGLEGNSFVSWEIYPQQNGALVVLTHHGVETFANNGKDFAKESFVGGWTYFLNEVLQQYLEKD